MRVENSLPASFSSAGKLQLEMEEVVETVGLPDEVKRDIKRTWIHEWDHRTEDDKKSIYGGEFGYSLQVGISDGVIMASWIAYYLPFGPGPEEDPFKMDEDSKGTP